MINLQYALQVLRPHILCERNTSARRMLPGKILLLQPGGDVGDDAIHVAAHADYLAAEKELRILPGAVVFVADCPPAGQWAPRENGCTLVGTGLPLAGLYNLLAEMAGRAEEWLRRFWQLAAANDNLHLLVQRIAQMAASPMLLLDKSIKVVTGGGLDGDGFLAGLAHRGAVLPEDINRQLENCCTAPAGYGAASLPGRDTMLFFCCVRKGDDVMGYLLLEGPRGRRDFDFAAFCILAAQSVSRQIFLPVAQNPDDSSEGFNVLLQQVMSRRKSESAEIKQALARFSHPVNAFVCTAVVSFEPEQQDHVPYSYLLIQLQEFFPDANITVYQKDIVILYTYERRRFRAYLDNEGLTALLKKHDGYMGVSNGTRNYGMLRSLYLITKRTIAVAKELRTDPAERVFEHENYGTYCVIDMCVQRFSELHGHEDIVYLVHPAVVHIYRKDQEDNTNLHEVLFAYLKNDRNLVKTAAATFMHRNTVLNKIGRIQQLIDIDFEDGFLRHRMLFSCMVIHYYEKVMKQTLQF